MSNTIERRIVRRLIKEADKLGYQPVSVDNGGGAEPVTGQTQTLEEAFAAGSATIFFEGRGERHWVFIVVGNGPDVISDYGYVPTPDGNEDASHPWNRLMEQVADYAGEQE